MRAPIGAPIVYEPCRSSFASNVERSNGVIGGGLLGLEAAHGLLKVLELKLAELGLTVSTSRATAGILCEGDQVTGVVFSDGPRNRAVSSSFGERNPAISAELRGRGAIVDDVCAYEWMMPADHRPLIDLIEQVVAGRVDALLVTSQIQFRNLRAMVRAHAHDQRLAVALSGEVVVGAIGPICAEAIREGGIVPDVLPSAANFPSLVRALADYFELTSA